MTLLLSHKIRIYQHHAFLFSLTFRCSPLNLSRGEKSVCITKHSSILAINIQSRRGNVVWGCTIFQEFLEQSGLSSCNFRQPCQTLPYSGKLYGKFDSLPKGGVDRYYEDHVFWLPKNVRREPLSIFLRCRILF